jgi:hypothetical protein
MCALNSLQNKTASTVGAKMYKVMASQESLVIAKVLFARDLILRRVFMYM